MSTPLTFFLQSYSRVSRHFLSSSQMTALSPHMSATMAQAQPNRDLEKDINDHSQGDLAAIGRFEQGPTQAYRASITPFAGRLGGQQTVILDPRDPQNAELLKNCPDATPYMSFAEQFDLRPFRTIGLWKAATMEGMGKEISFSFILRDASYCLSLDRSIALPLLR